MLKGVIDVVCAVIVDPERGVLACQRPAGKHLQHLWEFPGGKVEAGETEPDALIREIREELGVDVEVLDALSSVRWEYPEVVIRLHPYRCRIVDGVPVPHEHQSLCWQPLERLWELDWAEADHPIVRELRERAGLMPE